MKPTKMRNRMVYRATFNTKSKQLAGLLSKDLRKKYGKRSARVMVGDSITVIRGEFKGVDGKVSKVSTDSNTVAIDGVKKEKAKGEKFDVQIHASNILITGLNDEDKRRIARLEGRKVAKTAEPAGGEEPAKGAEAQGHADEPGQAELEKDTAGAQEPAAEEKEKEEEEAKTEEEEAPAKDTPEGGGPAKDASKDSKEEKNEGVR